MVAHAAAVVACLFENDLTKAHQYFQYTEDDSLTCEAAKVAEWTACALFGNYSPECMAAHAAAVVACIFENSYLTKSHQCFKNLQDESLTCEAAKMTEKAVCDYFGESSSECATAHAARIVACLSKTI